MIFNVSQFFPMFLKKKIKFFFKWVSKYFFVKVFGLFFKLFDVLFKDEIFF